MGNHNSLLFYQEFYEHLHRDVAGAVASVRVVECRKDIAVMLSRSKAEGLSFFTKTLPRLGKAVDLALSTGCKLQFSSFSRKKGTELPAFCWWLFSLVFDDTGRERSDACPMALMYLRQLLSVCYKLKVPYDEQTNNKVITDFVRTDAELAFTPAKLKGLTEQIALRARLLVRRVMSPLSCQGIIPKHGPGVVATGEKVWEKRYFKRLYQNLEVIYPFTEYFFFNYSHLCDRLDVLSTLEVKDAGTAKVVLVPKDSRGPRLISCEPLEYQWIQQGQMRAIVPHLESHWLTKGHVNFTDQSVNRQLALKASLDGKQSTLDMQEASDRVSWELVDYLFPSHWSDALYASRSPRTRLPDGRVVLLNKFAPMGSAVCFPVEALVFWALCVSIVSCTRNISLVEAKDTIYVYGDDIICSSEDQAAIRLHLPSFDLKVNDNKCCTGMTFKESCGCDAYKGVDVTPTKFRSVWCDRLDVGTYSSYVAYSNALWKAGYFYAAQYVEDRVQRCIRTPYFNTDSHDGIGFVRAHVIPRIINRKLGLAMRYSRTACHHLVLGFGSKTRSLISSRCDWEEMLRVVSYNAIAPNLGDLEHKLENLLDPIPQRVVARHYAKRRRNCLQRRWISMD
jgi:hypothetical protein